MLFGIHSLGAFNFPQPSIKMIFVLAQESVVAVCWCVGGRLSHMKHHLYVRRLKKELGPQGSLVTCIEGEAYIQCTVTF